MYSVAWILAGKQSVSNVWFLHKYTHLTFINLPCHDCVKDKIITSRYCATSNDTCKEDFFPLGPHVPPEKVKLLISLFNLNTWDFKRAGKFIIIYSVAIIFSEIK